MHIKKEKKFLRKQELQKADLDAWYLLEFVTGITKARYYMDPDQSMDPEAWEKYKEYLEKRRNAYSIAAYYRKSGIYGA